MIHKVFVLNVFCNTLHIMFIECLEQKTMRTNIKKYFFQCSQELWGEKVKKTTPSTVDPSRHNQHQPIKNISKKDFLFLIMSSISGKSLVSPQVTFKELDVAKVARNGKWRRVTPPMKSLFTDKRKQRMWMFFSLEN